MRLTALFTLATLVALLLETTIPHWLPIGMLAPNLVLILAVDLGMKHHGALGAIIAFAMGYAVDSFSGTHLGLNAFMLTTVYLMGYALSRYLISSSAAVGVFLVFVGAILTGLANSIGETGFAPGWGSAGLISRLALQGAMSALFAPLVFSIMGWGKRSVGLRVRGVRE